MKKSYIILCIAAAIVFLYFIGAFSEKLRFPWENSCHRRGENFAGPSPRMCSEMPAVTIRDKILNLSCTPWNVGARADTAANLYNEDQCLEQCTQLQLNEILANQLMGWNGQEFDVLASIKLMESSAQSGDIPNNPSSLCAFVTTFITSPINPEQFQDWKDNYMSTAPQAASLIKKYTSISGPCEFTA